ncbi:xanthine dehydrogenase family protein molybdopterin-binding subunit [Ferrovibrio sp.]|uniref:xanthine dehydrogenase family protein molybdopterin-binding subunit n=1 Tax=Ferrovibrio sp. TaxID=1917215 RepID=UPI0025BF5356|nr:xanthine dehydrogenase family protein molybdopterin-binding subunit [Ferrovibrio sp.]MBX3453641.1 xanthine dehydrogenase family protein molybdopterin-binding subunit [Ferrovibrio sp.]
MNAEAFRATGRVAGKRLPRMDGIGKVIGKHVYAADFTLPGMLYGRVLRSNKPHARIVKIDTSRAKAMPGVRTVITAADIPAVRYGQAVRDAPVFALDRVLFYGHAIAAVAATTLEIAEQALAAIDVELEDLPAVYDPEEALTNAILVHPDWQDFKVLPILVRDGNMTARTRMITGDADAAFANAYRVYEHRFKTALQHPGYTEPRASVADWDANGNVTVWTNTQLPFDTQTTLSEILDLPVSRVRVIVPGIGGGFGGKLRIGVEHYAALLARNTARPVRVLSTSEEELIAATPRQSAVVHLKTAVDRDGKLLGRQGRIIVDCGAFAGSGPAMASVSLQVLAGPYRNGTLALEGIAVYTNKVPAGSFRAPAGPMANFAVESQMDIIAEDLGIDPLELRLRNIVHEGDKGPSGEELKSVSVEECLRKAAAAIGWHDRKPAPGRGKGIACSWWMTTGGSSGVYVKIDPDGTATLVSGAVEIGTAALTGASQVLAEALSLDLDDIKVAGVDTQTSPYDYGAQGSRTAFSVGNACLAAAADLRQQLFELAAKQWNITTDGMELRDKQVIAGNKTIAIAELARLSRLSGGGLIAHGTANSPGPAFDPGRVENHMLPAWNTPSFHAQAADLSVDSETGAVSINRYVVAQDVGFAINPTYIEGQIEGGVSQGIGQALSEEIVYQNGRVMNANLTDYKMPTAMDVPEIECILVQSASAAGPFGAKGVGEPPCIHPPAALANAIAAATGARMHSLPMTAEKIVKELRSARE